MTIPKFRTKLTASADCGVSFTHPIQEKKFKQAAYPWRAHESDILSTHHRFKIKTHLSRTPLYERNGSAPAPQVHASENPSNGVLIQCVNLGEAQHSIDDPLTATPPTSISSLHAHFAIGLLISTLNHLELRNMTIKNNRHNSEWRCMYKGSFCPHMRSFKVDDSLHKLCDLHREMAIRNQRRWLNKRREIQRQKLQQSSTSPEKTLPPIDEEELPPIAEEDWLAIAADLLEKMTAEEILRVIYSAR